ncbi:MAG TPA: DUF4097 family beta strand repeat-containing protein [Vicinamibacterales bacterium]|nr:DUF4097 family beta strand repeat-containing protein [Vicinamibacterales bacterium]
MPVQTTARVKNVARRLPLCLLLLLAAAASGCDIVTAEFKSKESSEWRRTYPLQAGARVELSNVNGRIEVTAATGNTLEVVAVKTARGATPEAARTALDRIEIRDEATASGVRIETKTARGGAFNHGSGEVRYTVRVPPSANVRFTTVNGGIELTGLDGQVELESTNGGIRARDVSGSIDASTTNGGVDVELSRVSEPGVKLECTNGGIKLRLPPDAKATISASITNGGIDVARADGMALETRESTRRRLEATLNGGGPPIRLSGTNGGIHISPR